MNKTLITVLAGSLLLVGMPLATADETHPDCESGQDWISYNPHIQFLPRDRAFVCEGEHWDGQDPVNGAPSGDNLQNCANFEEVSADRNQHVSFCQDADAPAAETSPASLNGGVPVTFRVSSAGAGTDQNTYVALHIGSVGEVVLFAGKQGNVGTGAVYLRDSTFNGISQLNVLAQVVSAAGITRGYVSEKDCDHELYQNAARNGNRNPDDPAACGRDNTAITAHAFLP